MDIRDEERDIRHKDTGKEMVKVHIMMRDN